MNAINSILESGKIFVGNIAGMNDLNEKQLHNNDKDDVFLLCFCNSDSEKIPMWYLYSGLSGKGMRLGLTPSVMLDFIGSIKQFYEVGYDEEENKNKFSKPMPIQGSIEISAGWVFYKQANGSINYRRKWYNVTNYASFEKDNYFIKDYPWEYEKEFRLVFKNKTDKNFNKIALDIPEKILSKIKLSTEPEVDGTVNIFSMEGFKKYAAMKIEKSKLSINMDLLRRNKEDIIKNIGAIIDNKNSSIICGAIKKEKFCANSNGGNT